MRKSGIAMALLPNSQGRYELVCIKDITNNSITVSIHDKTITYSFTCEDQGLWCTRGYLDFSNSKVLSAT